MKSICYKCVEEDRFCPLGGQGMFNSPFGGKCHPIFIVETDQSLWLCLFVCLFFGLFTFSRAVPAAYGGFQARGLIGAVASDLHQSHSNSGSKPRLRPTPQLKATPDC